MNHLFTNAAGHSNNVATAVVNDNNAGLQLLNGAGAGNSIQIGVNLVNSVLDLTIQRGINMIAAVGNQLSIVLLGLFIPFQASALGQHLTHILDNGIDKVGIDFLGRIISDGSNTAALGAVVFPILFILEGTYLSVIAATLLLAGVDLVLEIDSVLQNDFLCKGFPILLFRKISVLFHHIEGIDSALLIALHAGHALAVQLGTVGVKQGRIVGNTDNGCAFSRGQELQLLAKILGSGSLNTLTAVAKEYLIQIPLHNNGLIVALFKLRCTENLQHLTLNGNIVSTLVLCQKQILNQLLCNGRAAELVAGADKHIDTGLDGGKPVNALMLPKTVVLDRNSSINHGLGNILIGNPITVVNGMQPLQHLDIAAFIHRIHIGRLVKVKALQLNAGLGQNLPFQIAGQKSYKYHCADSGNHQYRGDRTGNNLKNGIKSLPHSLQERGGTGGLPGLAAHLSFPRIMFIFHANTSKNSLPKGQHGYYFTFFGR